MKYVFILLAIVSIAWFTSCTKKIDVVHDIHDTLYRYVLKSDTFHTIVIHVDTIVKQDKHEDTVIQVRHDTLILTKTTTDTLFRNLFDTIYITRTLHDTITKTVYLHDTINNMQVVIQHDTIIKTNTVITVDTVYSYVYSLNTSYPLPATDSGQIFITYDTLPGFRLDSIQIINLASYVPESQTSQTPARYTQVSTYIPINYPNYGWMIHPVGPMICTMTFYYTWITPNAVMTTLQTFDNLHSWIIPSFDPAPPPNGTEVQATRVFSYIDLSKIFFIRIKNRY